MKVRKLKWRFYRKQGGPRGWGNRCKLYAQGCPCCDAYMFFYQHGRFPSLGLDEFEGQVPVTEPFEIDVSWDRAIADRREAQL